VATRYLHLCAHEQFPPDQLLRQAVAVLAAAGPGPESGWGAVSILIAIGVALVNLAHVVGLVLFESVHKRDGAARMFRRLALTATPVALVVNLAILLFA
jgi:hypothetical protein